jgi:hypothetical protein
MVCHYCDKTVDITQHKCEGKREGREFEGGAYRDGDHDKLDYARALDPRVLERYVAYLGANRLQSNGVMRDWDNWKQGIPKDVYISSAWRHMHTVWKSHIKGEYPEDELCAVYSMR